MRIVRMFTLGALVLGLSAAPAVAGSHGAEKPTKNIVQVAREAGQFETLIAALKAADLVGTLSGQGQGPFTVFAPTDAAFAKLPAGTVEALLADPAQLRSILLYHVVAGEYRAADIVSRSALDTVNGRSLSIRTESGVMVNDASVTAADIPARNGVIHVIDTVLLPQ